MIKIIEFNINEILLSEKACSDLITRVCLRHPVTPRHVTGLCSSKDKVFVILEQCKIETALPDYRFAPLSSLSTKDIGAQISARHSAGFRVIGSFIVDNELWALFTNEKPTENNRD